MRASLLLGLFGASVLASCSAADPYARVQPAISLCDSSDVAADKNGACPNPSPSDAIFTTDCVYGQKTGRPLSNPFDPLGETSSHPVCFYKRAYVYQQNVSKEDLCKAWPNPPASCDADSPAAASSGAPSSGGSPLPSPTPAITTSGAASGNSTPEMTQEFKHTRHEVIQQLMNLSDSNCNNFLGRLFAKQTGTSFAKGLVNVVSSSAAAITGFISVPTASALSAGNIAFGGGLDSINTNIYYSKTAPDIAKAILNKRQAIRSEIEAREAGKTAAQSATVAATDAKEKATKAAASCDAARKRTKAAPSAKAADAQEQVCKAAGEADTAARDAAYAASKASSAQTLQPLAGPYMISDAVSDVMAYDSYCSQLGGLMSLSSAVDAQSTAVTSSTQAQQNAASAQLSASTARQKAEEAAKAGKPK